MKVGDRVLIAAQVTGRAEEWTEATVIEVEQNPYGTVYTAETDDGEIFFEREDMFRLLEAEELCTQ